MQKLANRTKSSNTDTSQPRANPQVNLTNIEPSLFLKKQIDDIIINIVNFMTDCFTNMNDFINDSSQLDNNASTENNSFLHAIKQRFGINHSESIKKRLLAELPHSNKASSNNTDLIMDHEQSNAIDDDV